MPKLSAVITSFNNQETIAQCVDSVGFADEIVVLDSFSTDETLSILKEKNCLVSQQKFKGFSQQKQDAIELASYDWILLLDSDEFLTSEAQKKIKEWKEITPNADAYTLPRCEWVFWQWSNNWVHMNKFVRLFNRKKAHVSKALIHESIQTSGKTIELKAVIKHFSDASISKKVEKINPV